MEHAGGCHKEGKGCDATDVPTNDNALVKIQHKNKHGQKREYTKQALPRDITFNRKGALKQKMKESPCTRGPIKQ